jgi:electron transfer flavoprotein alpha subunit
MLLAKQLSRVSNRHFLKRLQSTLVLIEHKDGKIISSTLNAVTAASKLGFPMSALVAGDQEPTTDTVAKAAASITGIQKVIVAKDAKLAKGLPEAHAPLIVAATKAGGFTHVVGAHSAYSKNVLPRAAALLDVAPISDIIAVDSADSFQRPIYAGKLTFIFLLKNKYQYLLF